MKLKLLLIILSVIYFDLGCSFIISENNNIKTQKNLESLPTVSVNTLPTPDETETKIEKNLLSLANGAVLFKYPTPNSWQFSPVRIIDGTDSFWISNEVEQTSQVFVIGLPSETILKKFSFVNGNDYYSEGSNAKDILIEVSMNINSDYQTVLETSLPEDINENQMFPVKTEVLGKFVRLTIKNSHKNPKYISLGDFRGYGTQKEEKSLTGLTGIYFPLERDEEKSEYKILDSEESKNNYTHYANINLKQEGTMIYGCRGQSETNRFDGGIEGNIAQIIWFNNPENETEKATMSFSLDGKLLFHTIFTNDGGLSDYVVYQKISNTPSKCANINEFNDSDGKSQIEEKLEKDGRVIIYGINFDFNSDKLRDESKIILDKIVKILKENPTWKMTIEGHTDNIGGDAFNKNLSEKRATSVKNYLVNAGIESSRLTSSGLGLSKPVASNDTESGRAQNRRVELVKQ